MAKTTRRRWKAVWDQYRQKRTDVHVLPVQDLRDHMETRDCWCQPTITFEAFGAALVVHHSADGRELVEEHGIN